MIFQENEIVQEVEKYLDSEELATKLDELADELGGESAYWLKESAVNLRCLFDIAITARFHQMKREHHKKYGDTQ